MSMQPVPESFPLTLTASIGGHIVIENEESGSQHRVSIRANAGVPSWCLQENAGKSPDEPRMVLGLKPGYRVAEWNVTEHS